MVRLSLLLLLGACLIDKAAYEDALSALTDADGDGVPPAGGDCDDADPSRYPGAEEVYYDGIDADCAGDDDDDADGDGDPSVDHGGADCDDDDPSVHAYAEETWDDDGTDNDCDGDALESLAWSASEATTRLDGIEAGGEAGRLLASWPGGGCLFVGAPYTGESEGTVYAEAVGPAGVHELGTGGFVSGGEPYGFFASSIAVSEAGTAAMSAAIGRDGLGVAWLLDAEALCGGETGTVDDLAKGELDGPADGALFGVSARWLPDLDGDGIDELIVSAPGVTMDADGQGAAYLWRSPPSGGEVASGDDADVVLVGAYAGAALEDAQVLADEDEAWLVLSQMTQEEGDLALARIPADNLRSGSVADRADGGIYSYNPGFAVTVQRIGDMELDGSDNFAVGSFPWAIWDVRDLDGGVDASEAPHALSYDEEYLTGTAGVGDLDGDDRADLLLLAEDAPAGAERGRVAFFPGELLPPEGDVDLADLRLTADGANLGDSFGYRAVPAGDLDGDGVLDLAVAAPGADANGDQSGSVVLVPSPL